jgi:hypothetical protein
VWIGKNRGERGLVRSLLRQWLLCILIMMMIARMPEDGVALVVGAAGILLVKRELEPGNVILGVGVVLAKSDLLEIGVDLGAHCHFSDAPSCPPPHPNPQ